MAAEQTNRGEPIVEIRNLSKELHRDEITIPVLMDINVDLYTGDYMALMGPSGSGKTTLLNMIAGLDRPTSGSLKVLGHDLTQTSEGALRDGDRSTSVSSFSCTT